AVAVGFAPRVPDVHELAELEHLPGWRLDVDDVRLAGVDVQPVEARHGRPGGVGLDADVVPQVVHRALVDDLQRGVVVARRLLEPVALHTGDGRLEGRRTRVIGDRDD